MDARPRWTPSGTSPHLADTEKTAEPDKATFPA